MTLSTTLHNLVESIDRYGSVPSINFKGESNSKSLCGSFITVMALAFVGWFAYYFGKDMGQREDPNVILSNTIVEEPTTFNLGPNGHFTAAVGVSYQTTLAPIVNQSHFQALGIKVTLNSSDDNAPPTITQELLPARLCEPEDVPEALEAVVGFTYCLDQSQEDIEYSIKDWRAQFIMMRIVRCDSPLAPNQDVECADSAYIDFLTDNTFAMLYYTDLAIDPSNFEVPAKQLMNLTPFVMRSDGAKFTRIFLDEVVMTTDSGILWE
mmetsp:Transcript_39385/g.35080  ORF Transcript_39385/g.35080 Transcript_39385/m.35080 type:complete len:266 (+) Transcript_39385:41-838(+)